MLSRWFIPSTLFAATVALAPAASATPEYHQFGPSDSCTTITAGDGTSPWCLGVTAVSGQHQAYYWDYNADGGSGAWEGTGEYGTAIALAWNNDGLNIPFMLTNTSTPIIGGIAAGNDIGGTTTFSWFQIPGSGTSLSGASVWYGATGGNGGPFLYTTGSSSGTVECNIDSPDGGYSGWVNASPSGAGVQISVSQDLTSVWAITSTNAIYHLTDGFQYFEGSSGPCDSEGTWTLVSGSAKVISAGSGGRTQTQPPWIIGGSRDVYQYVGGSSPWSHIANNTGGVGPDGIAKSLSVGANGTIYIVDDNNDVWTYY